MSLQSRNPVKRALKLRKKEKLNDAIELLEFAREAQPDNCNVSELLQKIKLEKFQMEAGLNPPLEIQEKLKLLFDSKKWNHLVKASKSVERYFPNSVPILNMLGVAYRHEGDLEKSKYFHSRAIRLNSKDSSTVVNLANCYLAQGKFSEALTLIKSHLKQTKHSANSRSTFSRIYDSLGSSLYYLGLHEEAHVAYEKAIEFDPSNDEARFNLGAIKLIHKDFETGWKLREFRRSRPDFLAWSQSVNKPQWTGEKDSVVLCWAEQGLGDEVMAASCLKELSEQTKKLIVSADKRLLPVLAYSFPNIEFISREDNYHDLDFDYHIPNMTALGMLRPSEASFKTGSGGYLTQNETIVKELRNAIEGVAGGAPIIGISWKTEAAVTGVKRSIDLQTFLRAIPMKYTVVNLQYGDCQEEIEQAEMRLKRKIYTISDIDNKNDIASLGTLICACDNVVTVDNSTVHLAGAFGIKCHLLLPHAADFRWSKDDGTSYWYDSVKIMRQQNGCSWTDCLTGVSKSLG